MPDIWRHPGMAPDWSQIVAVSESWPRALFLMFNIPLTPYFQLPSRVRWFSRCWAVSIRSSSLLSRDASASRRKLAHLWKSSSFTTYETGRGLLVTLSGYTNGAPHSSWGSGTPAYCLVLHRIRDKILHHDILNAYIDERVILVFHDHQTSAESLQGSGDEGQRQGLRMPQIRCWWRVRYFSQVSDLYR